MNTYAVALINHTGYLGLRLKTVFVMSWPQALDAAFPDYLRNLSKGAVSEEIPLEAKVEAKSQGWEFDVLKVV